VLIRLFFLSMLFACSLPFTGTAGMAHAAGFIEQAPIKVGILHSMTGTMAASEIPVANATLLAIEQINQQGGLLGQPVEAITADGRSDEDVFASEAERLISDEHVSALFGCWTSASRKAVLPIVEAHQHLLFYPQLISRHESDLFLGRLNERWIGRWSAPDAEQ